MSYEGILRNLPGAIAAEDLSSHQFRFVKVTGENAVSKCTVAGEIVDGVLENKPRVVGDPAIVSGEGITKVELGASVAAGALVMTDASGRAITAAGFGFVCGRVMKAGTTGERVPLKLVPQGYGASVIDAQSTFADMDIYVNGTSGSDTTGDGSASAPFATFGKAFSVIPQVIKHVVTIRPAAGTYTSFPAFVERVYQGGTIVIDASGVTPTSLSGPHTIAAVTPLTFLAWSWMYFGNNVQAAAAPGWTPDDYRGKFALFSNGPWQDMMSCIFYNTTDTMRLGVDNGAPWVVGNGFSIVEPAVKVQVTHRVVFKNNEVYDPFFGGLIPQLVIAGVDFSSSYTSGAGFVFENIDVNLPFCSFKSSGNNSCVFFKGVNLNASSIAGLLDQAGLENDFSKQTYIAGKTLGARSVLCDEGAYLQCLITRDQIYSFGGMTGVYYSMCGECLLTGTHKCSVDLLYLEQQGYNGGGMFADDCPVILFTVWIERGAQAANSPCFRISGSGNTFSWTFQGNAAGLGAGNYSLEIREGGMFSLKDGTTTILAGAGAIKFNFGGTTHAAWPGSGVAFTDSAGSFVQRR